MRAACPPPEARCTLRRGYEPPVWQYRPCPAPIRIESTASTAAGSEMALLQNKTATAVRSSSRSLVAPPSRVRSVVVRASEGAAPAAPAAEKKAWTEPTLNPDTPSPIFGGSTGGLLRKAQVRINRGDGEIRGVLASVGCSKPYRRATAADPRSLNVLERSQHVICGGSAAMGMPRGPQAKPGPGLQALRRALLPCARSQADFRPERALHRWRSSM